MVEGCERWYRLALLAGGSMPQPVVKWASQARLSRGSTTRLLGAASVSLGPCLAMSGAQGT